MTNRRTYARADQPKSWAVGMNTFNVVSVGSIDTFSWIAYAKEWSGRVESEYFVDAYT